MNQSARLLSPRVAGRMHAGPAPGLVVAEATNTGTPAGQIVRPGRNAWRLARARRAAVLIDSAAYFAQVEKALLAAQHSITIVGWDFNSRICLRPQDGDDAEPLVDLLLRLVEERPGLQVRVLVWNMGPVYAGRSIADWLRRGRRIDHPRIVYRSDRAHPHFAAHHQKILCVDGCLAFAGGIDLTAERWDTRAHRARNRKRLTPDGSSYAPVHDIQMLVDGEAAAAMCELVAHRWQVACGERLAPLRPENELWPEGLRPDFEDVEVAIARTIPPHADCPAVRETARLNVDALRSAQKTIYIETQYLAAPYVADILARHLRQPGAPDVVILTTATSNGLIEERIMGGNRRRIIKRLHDADRFGRLRILYPVVPNGSDVRPVQIHSKLVLVDDRFIRIGSSNLNNRSIGLDTECDLAIEPGSEASQQTIAALRNRLLAEHMGTDSATVATAAAELGSLTAAIDRLGGGRRGLRRFPVDEDGPAEPLGTTCLFDPDAPYGWRTLRQLLGQEPIVHADQL